MRGSRHDYDRWANYTGDTSWRYNNVLPYFLKSQNNTLDHLKDSKFHSSAGPFAVSRPEMFPVSQKIIQGCQDIGFEFNEDYNGASMSGVSESQVNHREGIRMSTSRAFLHPVLHRNNLHVSVNSRVTRIIFENKKAVGVEFVKDGGQQVVKCSKEVILSGGAVGSPHLLMLSGVGPRRHLEKFNIPVVSDVPVGDNLQDHVWHDVPVAITEPLSEPMSILGDLYNFLEFVLFGTGPAASTGFIDTLLFTESKNKKLQTPIDWPNLQIHFFSVLVPSYLMDQFHMSQQVMQGMKADREDKYKFGFSCLASIIQPDSRGTVRLRSNDPNDAPYIVANYFHSQKDLDDMLESISICLDLIDSPTLRSVGARLAVSRPYGECEGHEFKSRDYWECEAKARPSTIYHPVGTCKMGADDDVTAVVDSQLR